MSAIPLLLINLDRSSERLEHMKAELGALGLAFERICAVDGKAEGLADDTWQISGPEVGCFLSHRLAWQRIVDAGWPHAIVLEDDVRLHPTFARVVEDGAWVPPRADIVKLDTRHTVVWLASPREGESVDGMTLRELHSVTWGGGAYLLKRACAERLLAVSEEARMPLDMFLFGPSSTRRHADMVIPPPLRILQCCPSPVIAMHRVDDRPELASLLEDGRTFAEGVRVRRKARTSYRLLRPLHALLRPLRRLGRERLRPLALRLRGARPERVPYADGHRPTR
ncbi:MAG: glycosyltransferase family 25 protein [Planctomycetota bacterium]|nr:glycosyltransferase family 25 protein [Planctomycetota bacterium]